MHVVGTDGVSPVAGTHVRMLTTAGEVLAGGTATGEGIFCVEKLPPDRDVLQVGDPGLRASIVAPAGGAGLEVTVIMPSILNVPADASAALATPVRPSAAVAYEAGREILVVPLPFQGKESLLRQRWEPPVVGSTAPGRGSHLE